MIPLKHVPAIDPDFGDTWKRVTEDPLYCPVHFSVYLDALQGGDDFGRGLPVRLNKGHRNHLITKAASNYRVVDFYNRRLDVIKFSNGTVITLGDGEENLRGMYFPYWLNWDGDDIRDFDLGLLRSHGERGY